MNEKAKQFLHNLTFKEKQLLAERCGIALSTLRNMMYSGAKPSLTLAARMERETFRKVSKKDLRPDIDWSDFS